MSRNEDNLQESCVTWFRYQYPNHFITSFAAGFVFSGDKVKRQITGNRMKAMGYKNGTPDLFIAHHNKFYHGLFIEMKFGNNKPTDSQNEAMFKLEMNGYKCAVCYCLEEFIEVVNRYFNDKI